MNVCFNGCSFTVGEGFPEEQRDTYVYDRLICRSLKATHKNIAKEGSSNLLIFQRCLREIMHSNSDIIFNQWSALNRLWLSPGPDAWIFVNDEKYKTFSYRHLHLSEKKLKDLKNNLLLANHDYQNIIDLCLYVETLDNLAKKYNKKVFHINGILPWQKDLVDSYTDNNLYNDLHPYTKEILDFNDRNDAEILYFFKKLRDAIKLLDKNTWVNMFNSWQSNLVDDGPVGHHPGIESNKWMSEQVLNFMENKI